MSQGQRIPGATDPHSPTPDTAGSPSHNPPVPVPPGANPNHDPNRGPGQNPVPNPIPSK